MKNNEEIFNLVFKIRNSLEYVIESDGRVTILEKQDHKIQRFFRFLNFKIPLYKKITLDKYSSAVFNMIDGRKNVKEIGENLEAKFGKEVYPLYERLLIFLNHIDVNCRYIEKVHVK